MSDRTNHAFLAVYDLSTQSLSYIDPSTDRDANPAWSPDGKQLAFTRTPAGGGGGGRGGGASQWTIRVASVADGASRQIWKADPGPGSAFHAVVAEDQLFWAAGNRIVFPWEKEGWSHLYSVPLEGGTAVPLTPGNFEVEHVAYSDDGKQIVYSSNQDDIDRRHLWRVSTAAGPPTALTKGKRSNGRPRSSVAVSPSCMRMRAILPGLPSSSAALRRAIWRRPRFPPIFQANRWPIPQQIIYTASDGMQIHGQLFLPPDSKPGDKHAALVFLHGGSRRQMLLGWHYMDYYNNAYGMNQYLASQGYVVLSVNYRSGIGYGLGFREAVNHGAAGASEFHDVEGAGLYLKSRADVDPAHIGLWGGSYGGYLTALGLARDSALFAAGVDFHGVHDWSAPRANPGPAAAASHLRCCPCGAGGFRPHRLRILPYGRRAYLALARTVDPRR